MKDDIRLKRKLAATRAADAEHDAMMQDAAKRAGVILANIRGMYRIEDKDAALLRMFRRAGEKNGTV